MFNIQTLNKIAACGTQQFGENYTVSDEVTNPDGIVLRSFNMHEMELQSNLKAVARAGAGVNNIPIDKCSEQGIVVFNTPGANANAVKELVIAGLLMASRKITDAVTWAKTLENEEGVAKLVEKGKSNFAGPEIAGKTLGVVGLGAIGVMVANAAHHLGMNVIGYDPYISINAAWNLSHHIEREDDLQALVAKCDYISLHVPQNDATKGMINKTILDGAKDGIRILNFARGGLVQNEAMAEALESGKVACYVTDFPDETVLKMNNVVAIPHLGASTPESEDNCATMACSQLKDFMENGNVVNSVNFPECVMPRSAKERLFIAHKNVPKMISAFSQVFADKGINIENMINKSKGDLAVTLIDTDSDVSETNIQAIEAMENILAIRVIK